MVPSSSADNQPTRAQLLQLLKREGELSVKQLSSLLGITPMGVRQHLEALQREGKVEFRWNRHGSGRPSQLFRLTPTGDELFHRSYAEFASQLLELAGQQEQLPSLLHQLREAQRRRYAAHIDPALPLAERAEALARLRAREGYSAQVNVEPDGSVIFAEGNCSIRRIAEGHPELCRSEERLLSELLQAQVERESCIANGQPQCRYRLRVRPA